MKKLIVLPLALGLLAACSSTPYVDKEFGQANRLAFDTQIADQTYRHADKTPEGITGLNAEKIMKGYNDGFGKVAKDQDVGKTFKMEDTD